MVNGDIRELREMEALCLDVLHSDWHDWRGGGEDEDRLLEAGWLEQLAAHWRLPVVGESDEETVLAVKVVRTVMQNVVRALLAKKAVESQDMVVLNTYLQNAPIWYFLSGKDGTYRLEQEACASSWQRVPGEIALSFARLLAKDPARIKQCENADCRWIYYDESANQTRRWCEDACANLMRVRRFREKKREKREKSI